jgi:hypothetical protein
MKFNLIGLGAVCALAFGLAFGSFAGSVADTDSDGVPDVYDNCTTTPNGSLAGTGACVAQEDANLDGFGNPCDFDVNQDGSTGLDDVGQYVSALGGAPGVYDSNCDGAVGLDDVGNAVSALGSAPGPSSLGCAGTIPCSAE